MWIMFLEIGQIKKSMGKSTNNSNTDNIPSNGWKIILFE